MKTTTKIALAIVLIFNFQLLTFNCVAQDIHFSQITMTPLQLDPSQAGKINGSHRVIINYRNQWASVASPFKTYGFSYDTQLKSKKNNFFGLGASVYSDKAGDIDLGLTIVNISIAYHIKIDNLSFLSAGVQGGFSQNSIDGASLRFKSQFDGNNHNDNLSSGETFKNTSFLEPDFSAGVSYTYSTNHTNEVVSDNGYNGKRINIGASIHHITSPNNTFLEQNTDNLDFRYVIHTNTSFGLKGTNIAIQPSGIFSYQQKATDFIIGSFFRYNLKEKSKYSQFSNGAALNIGMHYRISDAFIPSLFIETGSFAFGVSYDLNLSGLSSASNGNGGFEISIRYISPNPFKSRTTIAAPRF